MACKASASGMVYYIATLSNCGESLKLQLPQPAERYGAHQGNDLGDGKNVEDWVTCSQPLCASQWAQFND